MRARIYQPARNAMQSGTAKTKSWVLDYAPLEAKQLDPLMGWTGSGDTRGQVRLTFDSCAAAEEHAKRLGLEYTVQQPRKRAHLLRNAGYGDNFAHDRRTVWTH